MVSFEPHLVPHQLSTYNPNDSHYTGCTNANHLGSAMEYAE
jgi:hypothetical protein